MSGILKRANSENVFHSVQAVAIVVGGCWVVFQYFSHDRDRQGLALEQQRLANIQAEAVAQTSRQAEEARLSQLTLGNKQAETALLAQRKSQELSLEQQRLTNEQASLMLRISETQQRLRREELEQTVRLQQQDIDLKRLQQSKAEHDLSYSSRYRFEDKFKIEHRKVRDVDDTVGEYEVDHSFDFVNRSEVELEMSLFILDYYIGLPVANQAAGPFVMPLGTPRDRWNPSSQQKGAYFWRRLGSTGAIYAEAIGRIPLPWNVVVDDLELIRGGAGTGVLKTEQRLSYSDAYIVRAPRNAYVAFMMSWCFNRCTNNDDLYSDFSSVQLEGRSITTPAIGAISR